MPGSVSFSRASLLVVAVVLLAAAAAALGALRGLAGAGDLPTGRVERGDFVRRVEAEGNIEARQATVLTAPLDIEMPIKIAWIAPDGSRVRAGEVVVRFDPTDMEQEFEHGVADRDTADSKIEQTRVVTQSTLKNLDRDAEIASREVDYAREFQNKDTEIFSRSEIIESQIDERLATRRQQHARQSRGVREDLSRVELDLLAIEKRKAVLKIERAETGLRRLELEAPHDGIFVRKEHWDGPVDVGTMVWRGNPVAEIPQLDEMVAKVYVLEADAGGLEAGLEADLLLEAWPGEVHRAVVEHVDALPTRRLRRSPVQYFAVTLTFDEAATARMKPGQRVRAMLLIDELHEVLTVPREAVFETEGKKIAYRAAAGGFEAVEVTTGPNTPGRVVIESGLEEGDRVALRDPTRPLHEAAAEGEEPAVPGGAAGALR